MKLTRVTVDLDFGKPKTLFVLTKLLFLKRYNWYSFELRKSPSHNKLKKGYHLIIWFYNDVPKFKLRRYFNDDKNRIRIDRMHRKNKQFLFSAKRIIQIKGGAKNEK